jgi:ABC-2 type transport system ATP-binding protein
MSGRENLEHFARMLRVPSSEIERVASLVNLAHRLDQRVGTYSLGMRQRLGIAQAMLGDPRVLILDEPANGLDPAGIREIRELLRNLAAERGMAVFVSSHLLAEIELTADRVAIIRERGVEATVNGDVVLAPIEEPDAPRIIAALTQHGVALFHARQRVQTLEEMFLEATGGETVD